MRCFLGLDISSTVKLNIDSWRDKALPGDKGKVPMANFHVTSVFLGQVPHATLEHLIAGIDELTLPKCEIHFNDIGYWSKPKVSFLGSTAPHEHATQIATQVTQVARRCGLTIQERKYVPHVTLFRKVSHAPPPALIAPDFPCTFDKLHLFESQSTNKGVRYPIRHSWSLGKPYHF